MLLTECVEKFLASPEKRIEIRNESTRQHYRRSVSQFSEALQRPATLDDFNPDALAVFAAWTLESGWEEATANQRLKQIKSLWAWAARKRMVQEFPPRFRVPEPERSPRAWRPEELQKLFDGCAKMTGWIGPHDAGLFALALHHFLLDSGERIDAALKMTPAMVDYHNRTARLPAKIRKGGMKGMIYRLRSHTCDLLKQMERKSDEPYFIVPWKHRSSFYGWYRQLLQTAGLDYECRKSGPHKMRCTVLTMVAQAGGNATEFARHSSAKVTDSYLDREILVAHTRGTWPPEEFDPTEPGPTRSGLGGWLRRLVG